MFVDDAEVVDGDAKLNEVLALGHLSGLEYDQIERRLFWRIERRRHWAVAGGVVSLAAAVALTLGVFGGAESGFRAKGQATAAGVFATGCGARGGRTCAIGSTLVFSVNTAVATGHFGAYAERIDRSGQRIWYFPARDGTMPFVSSGGGTRAVPQGVRIGQEHAPGRYRVSLWIADRALSRVDAARLIASATIVPSTFEIDVVP